MLPRAKTGADLAFIVMGDMRYGRDKILKQVILICNDEYHCGLIIPFLASQGHTFGPNTSPGASYPSNLS